MLVNDVEFGVTEVGAGTILELPCSIEHLHQAMLLPSMPRSMGLFPSKITLRYGIAAADICTKYISSSIAVLWGPQSA